MNEMWKRLELARTLLYVPGHRPDRFAKAEASGADAMVLDLEDAVGPDVKPFARENVRRWLVDGGSGLVRINSSATPWYTDDVAMLSGGAKAVILPKAEGSEQIANLLSELEPGSCVIPIVETAVGILNARDICSSRGVVRVIFGGADLARDLGVDHTDRAALAYARSQVVVTSAACGLVPPLDGATTSFDDEKALIADTEDAFMLGFGGKSCIHPRQIPVVRTTFAPSPEEIRWARDVLAVAGDGSAASLDGQFIGKPVVDRARRLLSQFDVQLNENNISRIE